jgi:hypothetical protein
MHQDVMRNTVSAPSAPTEDSVTKAIEACIARVPSSALLSVALGAMGLSLLGPLGGRGKWGNFIAQWVPTILIMGGVPRSPTCRLFRQLSSRPRGNR